MRTLLLTAFALLVTATLHAQLYEGAIGYGIGSGGKPQGVPSEYQGSSSTSSPAIVGMFHYNISDVWQIGGSVDFNKWERKGNWNSIGGTSTPVTLTVASPATSFCVRFNRVVPFYSMWNPEVIKSYLYIGVSAGMVFTVNDGGQSLSSDGQATFNYQNGKGYTVGLQAGYVYYLKKHLGVYGEIAPRYANIKTSDARNAHSLESFHLTAYSITLGLRYRFKYDY